MFVAVQLILLMIVFCAGWAFADELTDSIKKLSAFVNTRWRNASTLIAGAREFAHDVKQLQRLRGIQRRADAIRRGEADEATRAEAMMKLFANEMKKG